MTFTRAVLFGYLLISHANFLIRPSVTSMLFAMASLVAFVGGDIFGMYEKMSRKLISRMTDAANRSDMNEERLKQVVEAGVKMSAKISELEARMTRDSVGQFAGLKR